MSDKVKLTVNAEDFKTISSLYNGEPTKISPLIVDSINKPSQQQLRGLVKAGIAAMNGSVAQKYKPLIDSLATASYYSEVRFGNSLELMTYKVYFDDNDNSVVFSTDAEKNILLQFPGNAMYIAEELKNYFGYSGIVGCDLNFKSSITDGIVMAAVLDIIRKKIFFELVGGQNDSDMTINPQDIQAHLSSNDENLQWISNEVKFITMSNRIPSINDITQSMSKLISMKYADGSPNAFSASSKLIHMCKSAAFINHIINIYYGAVAKNG